MKSKNFINFKNSKFLEFYGIMMGDGCLSQFYANYDKRERKVVVITCNAVKDYEYVSSYISSLIKDIYGFTPYIRINKKQNVIIIYITNKYVFYSLQNYDFPVGKKYQISIPRRMMNLPKKKINHIIRGIFDTDGCISARKDENYLYPHILISSYSQLLRQQLKEILQEQNFRAYIHDTNVVIKGKANFIKWFKLIGSSNSRNINKYKEWLETGKIIPKGLIV